MFLALVAVTLVSLQAPVPPFDVGMSPDPTAGTPATVVLAFADDIPLDHADAALAIVWADDYGGRPLGSDVERLPVEWRRTGPGRLEGTVTFPRAGRWLLVAVPGRPDDPPSGYADTIAVDVAAASTPSSGWMLVAIAAAVVGIGLARRRSKPTRTTPNPRLPRPRRRTPRRY